MHVFLYLWHVACVHVFECVLVDLFCIAFEPTQQELNVMCGDSIRDSMYPIAYYYRLTK